MKERRMLYYLSRKMALNELKYSPIEKLCLILIFSIQKLKHYFQSHSIHLVSKANPLKYVMAKPVLSDRLARWYLQLQQFEITYVPQKAVKGQVLVDFLADHPMPAEWELSDDLPDEDVLVIEVTPPWKMYFDRASHKEGANAGVVFVTTEGEVRAMEEAHSGVCGAHQSRPKLYFRIKRIGYYWPTMVKDCIDYVRKCQACQFHANLIHQPPEPLHPIVASWPFDAWVLDVMGPLTKSSGGRLYILAATDYFSK
ncbi:UNVERIFIED_CONTAM: hypothetical protein Sradi_4858500 [Sesamum radiatum]|uniref:Integrase catalytic domain-containing protein n=1 Tax=Sesamum radiatum TaxID=300843 RepID=A0AAW2MZ71_SESRA